MQHSLKNQTLYNCTSEENREKRYSRKLFKERESAKTQWREGSTPQSTFSNPIQTQMSHPHPHSQSHSHSLLETNPSGERENGKVGNGESGRHEEEKVEEELGKCQAVKRKKLADGFYEVEAIRKKRICKGELQYLIKWHGYPESANTWEPIDNLHMCRDIVEAFEESLSSGQKKSSRRRKRIFTREKKKMQNSYGVTMTQRVPIKMTFGNVAHDSAALNDNSSPPEGRVEVTVEHSEGVKRSKAPKTISNAQTVPVHVVSDANNHGPELSGLMANARTLDEHFQQIIPVEGDNPINCQSKVTSVEERLSNQHRGAKRRKSGSVRRVTLEATALDIDDSGNTVLQSSCDRVEQLGRPDSHCKKKIDSPRSSAVITRLIKPISYSTSVTNNIQDVSVTFVAMRSDGKEVMVDNKFLRANNPHLLIDFYEQHLRPNVIRGVKGPQKTNGVDTRITTLFIELLTENLAGIHNCDPSMIAAAGSW